MVAAAGALWTTSCTQPAWEEERDKTLREAVWTSAGSEYRCKQLLSDASLWMVLKNGEFVAMIGIYVDDIIAAGPKKLVNEILDMIGNMASLGGGAA